MVKVDNARKTRLMELGVWPEFLTYRDSLMLSGRGEIRATKEALAKYLGEPTNPSHRTKRPEEAKSDPKPKPKQEVHATSAIIPTLPTGDSGVISTSPDMTEVEMAAIRFVAENMSRNPADLIFPSGTALNLFNYCATEAAKKSFWQTIWPKILPKVQVEENKSRDKKSTELLLETIKRVSDMASGASGVTA